MSATPSVPPSPDDGLPPVPWRPLGAGLVVLAAVPVRASARTEYHRDELDFLAAGRRLAWGYLST